MLDKDGFIQFKLNHFYSDWRSGVQCFIKSPLWNKEICIYSSAQLCFPFFCFSPLHTSFLRISSPESTLLRLFPHFFGTFVETMKPGAPVSSGCRHELTLLPRGWGPENSELPPSVIPHFLLPGELWSQQDNTVCVSV